MRLSNDGYKQENWPDLVLLDGGETHLNMMRIYSTSWINNSITYAALAKKEETLHRPGENRYPRSGEDAYSSTQEMKHIDL